MVSKKLKFTHKEKKMSNRTLEAWSEIKTLVESLDADVQKNAHGNSSAGARARKGLRLLKTKTAELVKVTLQSSKDEQQAA